MRVEPILYDDLLLGSSEAVDDLCTRLHSHGFALLRYPTDAQDDLVSLRAAASGFFALPKQEKTAIGDFRFVGGTYAGYRDSVSIDSEFLEVHTTASGDAYPPLPAAARGLSAVAASVHARLDAMARHVLHLLAAHIGVSDQVFIAPLDPPKPSAADDIRADSTAATTSPSDAAVLSSSVLRVCHYRRRGGSETASGETLTSAAAVDLVDADARPTSEPPTELPSSKAAPPAADGTEVLFDTHTDSSLLTLSTLCPAAPGLQLQHEGEWLSVESLDGVSELDLEVHVGDFLAFLTREYFPSCVHRVTRPQSGPGRLSFPFLVRPRQEHVLDTRAYDCQGTNARLVEVSGITCRELRKLFDARGKRVLDESEQQRRMAEEREAQRKARAAAFRAAFLARGGQLEDSSSEDDDDGTAVGAAGAAAPLRGSVVGSQGGAAVTTDAWTKLLLDAGLSHLSPLVRDQPLETLARLAMEDRVELLKLTKQQMGVDRLADRQALANALAQHARGLGFVAQKRAPAASVLHSRCPLTIQGKQDGFGSQLMAQMSGVAFCSAQGRPYIHSPMERVAHLRAHVTAAEMDAFGGMGERSGRVADLDEFERAALEVRPFCEEVAREPDLFTEPVRRLLRRKYDSGASTHTRLPACFTPRMGAAKAEGVASSATKESTDVHGEESSATGTTTVVAVHVRRGDVTAIAHPSRYSADAKYYPLLHAIARRHPGAHLLLLSEGDPADFETLVQCARALYAGVELLLDGDPRVAFHTLVHADVILPAKSAFSYAAAVLSSGVVYCDLVRTGIWGWHRPLSVWRRAMGSEAAQPPPPQDLV